MSRRLAGRAGLNGLREIFIRPIGAAARAPAPAGVSAEVSPAGIGRTLVLGISAEVPAPGLGHLGLHLRRSALIPPETKVTLTREMQTSRLPT